MPTLRAALLTAYAALARQRTARMVAANPARRVDWATGTGGRFAHATVWSAATGGHLVCSDPILEPSRRGTKIRLCGDCNSCRPRAATGRLES